MTTPSPSSSLLAPSMGSDAIPDRDKIRAIPWSIASSTLNIVFCSWTFGGSVFLLFLDRLNLPKGQIGWLLSLFPFTQVLGLWVAPWVAAVGQKRIFLTFFGARKLVIAGLLLVPPILATYGRSVAVPYVYAIVLTFALCRAMAETAYYPWFQEFVPDRVRGVYSAATNIIPPIMAAGALIVASRVLDWTTGLSGFMGLIGAGSVIGFVGAMLMIKVPGGRPRPRDLRPGGHVAGMREALGNPNFRAYLAAFGLITIGLGVTASFLPLFFKERMGLPSGQVVMMDVATMAGAVLSSYPWGWIADRFGSRPVLMPSLTVACALPLLLFLLPHLHAVGTPLIAVLCMVNGMAMAGFGISASRLLFNSVIPHERSMPYTALYYAWMGLPAGLAPLLAGRLLSLGAAPAPGGCSGFLDGYSLVFMLGLTCVTVGTLGFRRVRPDSSVLTRHLIRRVTVAAWDRLDPTRP